MPDENYRYLIRCQFNAYCKKVIRNRAKELKRNLAKQYRSEVFIEDIPAYEQQRVLEYGDPSEDDQTCYLVKGRIFTKDQLHEAIRNLPDKKMKVIHLYYFDHLNDAEIAGLLDLPRRSANYRRNKALESIRSYLEGTKNE